jgi:hypothetical protein
LGKTRKDIKDQMFSKEINVKASEIPPNWSTEAADFINKLLRRKSKERLGKGGIIELKEHSWLRGIQWTDIYKKEVITPFKPKPGDNFDSQYCNKQDVIDRQTYDYYLNKVNSECFFQKFYFNFYDPKSKDPFFEMDGSQLKFFNPHEENTNKVESTPGRQQLKSSLTSTSINTPRITDHHLSNISHHTYFNKSTMSQRRLFNDN